MRVVVDAHSGAIRAVNRIVPGPGSVGPIGMMPPPYGAADFEGPDMPPSEVSGIPPGPPLATRTVVHASVAALPPLPRPRPAALASRKDADNAMSGAPAGPPGTSADKPDVKSSATIAAPAAVLVAPDKPPPPAPLND